MALNNIPLFLASKSPRRSWLLEQADLDFTVVDSDAVEIIDPSIPILQVAEDIAKQKAVGVKSQVYDTGVLITADTVVIQGDEILGKPKSKAEAKTMLQKLSNGQHVVTTGVCMYSKDKNVSFTSASEVQVAALSDEEIEHYIEKYQPMDKAGAYGIQEWFGWCKITSIKGSYANIMGLPIDEVYAQLRQW